MQEPDKDIIVEQKKAAAFLTRKLPRFESKSAEQLAADAKAEAEEQAGIEAEEIANAQIGNVMKDGTIYAGISPDTNQPMYAAPMDSPMSLNFNAAAKYAKDLEVGGKKDFRIPTKAELNVLFQNHEKGSLKGTFNLSGPGLDDWYRSSTLNNNCDELAYDRRFSDGKEGNIHMLNAASVRCVR